MLIRLIRYYRWTTAYPPEIIALVSATGLCYVLVKAALDLKSSPCECERPIDGEHSLGIQTRDASDSRAWDGTGAADKGPVYVLSGPAGVKIYPTLSSQALCTMWIWRQRELIQFGYLKFRMPTGSAVVEVAQIADRCVADKNYEEDMRTVKRKLFQRQVWCSECWGQCR